MPGTLDPSESSAVIARTRFFWIRCAETDQVLVIVARSTLPVLRYVVWVAVKLVAVQTDSSL